MTGSSIPANRSSFVDSVSLGPETSALLAWYDRHRRDLPWRRTRDPWAIWVSEVMLQQTRVETARPYFERFLARFPTFAVLAAAPTEEVLALWSGLGYYRRARQLQRAAQQLVEAGGSVPETLEGLRALPGVGEYTAAAVASIAFGLPAPVFDGNVARVAARLLAEPGDPARAEIHRRLATRAAELFDPRRPGDANQALMELGATLCTPRAPNCVACPLESTCRGHESGRPEDYPPARHRRATRDERHFAALVELADGRLLFVRRAEDEPVMAGLWELPTVVAAGRAAAERALAGRFGGEWRLEPAAASVGHRITFRAIEIVLCRARWSAGEVAEGVPARWARRPEAAALALTGATRKLLGEPAADGGTGALRD